MEGDFPSAGSASGHLHRRGACRSRWRLFGFGYGWACRRRWRWRGSVLHQLGQSLGNMTVVAIVGGGKRKPLARRFFNGARIALYDYQFEPMSDPGTGA